MHVPIHSGLLSSIQTLDDDRIFITRVPDELSSMGFILVVILAQSVKVYHIKPETNSPTLHADQINEFDLHAFS